MTVEQAISCASVSDLAGSAPKRLPIAQLGVRYKGAQKIEITRTMLSQVVANFRKMDTGQVPIDYDHAIEAVAGSGVPVPAAGWIKSIDDEPDGQGILWGTVRWTTTAERMIQAGEYKYISPVIDPSKRDNKTGDAQGWTLTSAALTNQPVLQGMPALVLSEGGSVAGQQVKYDDGWNAVQNKIDRLTQQKMASDPHLTYQAAFCAVMAADPKLAEDRWAAVQAQIVQRVKTMMAGNSQLTYAAALTGVLLEDSNLAREYREARIGVLAPRRATVDDTLGVEISTAVQEKIAASEGGRMDYTGALRLVLRDRPDLERRYKDTLR